ncbi:hypothetical protein VR46_11805 [Streptomyces sp. NRRL S-444]|nr:hypothetical protein VR46_11805 [Streptomyces sp. NRRL S-444]
MGEFAGEGRGDLFDGDAARVGEIAAELEEGAVGRVERGDLGEDGAGQGAVHGDERLEDHPPNRSEAPSPDGREGASAATVSAGQRVGRSGASRGRPRHGRPLWLRIRR